MPKQNLIWVTRTSAGYCLRFKYGQMNTSGGFSQGYLTPNKETPEDLKAGYAPFPEALVSSTTLRDEFYARGVKVKIDKDAQEPIPPEEAVAFRKVIGRLESLAKSSELKQNVIGSAIKRLRTAS